MRWLVRAMMDMSYCAHAIEKNRQESDPRAVLVFYGRVMSLSSASWETKHLVPCCVYVHVLRIILQVSSPDWFVL